MKALPPIRSTEDQSALWEGLMNGALDTIATDHAPHLRQNTPGEAVGAAIWDCRSADAAPAPPRSGDSGKCTVQDVVPGQAPIRHGRTGYSHEKGRFAPAPTAISC